MQLKILEVVDRVPSVRTLRFEKPSDFHFRPGQFVLISAQVNGEAVKRAYSIASSPTEPHLDVTLKKVEGGKLSPVLYEQKAGNMLDVKGPFGRFYLDEDNVKSLVLVCGGTGITPARSIIKFLVDKNLDHVNLSLFEGARKPNELIYKDEFESIHKEHSNIGIFFTVNESGGQEWPWHQGYIDVQFIKECAHQLIGPVYYLCGPPKMVQNIMHQLEEEGVPPKDIHMDQW